MIITDDGGENKGVQIYLYIFCLLVLALILDIVFKHTDTILMVTMSWGPNAG